MKIIGISGKAGSGKTESAKIIKTLLKPNEVNIISFADKLKTVVSCITGLSYEDIDNNKSKKLSQFIKTNEFYSDKTIRDILRDTADFMRFIYDDIFVDDAMAQLSPNKVNVIHDVRFFNEVKAIKQRGGKLIRIVRDVKSDNHLSETQLDNYEDYDYVVINNGNLPQLEANLAYILKDLNLI